MSERCRYIVDAASTFARPVPEEDQIRAQLEMLEWPDTGKLPSLWWPSATRAMVAGHVVAAEGSDRARRLSGDFIGQRLRRSTSQPVKGVEIVSMRRVEGGPASISSGFIRARRHPALGSRPRRSASTWS